MTGRAGAVTSPSARSQPRLEPHAFVRTRPVVKLFEIGTEFVSRSEAGRVLDGLDHDVEVVDVDAAGVPDVGQGFADELLRVWPGAHPNQLVAPAPGSSTGT